MDKSLIGKKIKNIREMVQESRKDFAKSLRINYSTLANYENGNRLAPTELLIEICNQLWLYPEFFFSSDETDYQKWLKSFLAEKQKAEERTYNKVVDSMEGLWDRKLAPRLYRYYIEQNNFTVEPREILVSYFEELNQTGKQEAMKRVEELTHIEKYTIDKKEAIGNERTKDSGREEV